MATVQTAARKRLLRCGVHLCISAHLCHSLRTCAAATPQPDIAVDRFLSRVRPSLPATRTCTRTATPATPCGAHTVCVLIHSPVC